MKKTFTGNTRICLCISGAIIVVAMIMQILGFGLNLGIDFTGGSILNYSVGEEYDVADVETVLQASGYSDSQITKAAPSSASIALQDEIAAGTETVEAHSEHDGHNHTEEELAALNAAAEEASEADADFKPMLNLDKSGITADGMTDLQIRLKLVDEAAGMEDCLAKAVQGEKTGYRTLTNLEITENNYDVSYAGGYIAEFDMNGAFDADAMKDTVSAALEAGGYAISGIDCIAYEGENGEALRILINMDDVTSQVRATLEKEMTAKYPNFRFVSIDHVSAVAGKDLLSNAVKALLIAFVCMLIYIAIRFDALSGAAALFGLVHDILIMCAFMVFFRSVYQVNSSFIAAILTIVGYSINNTIIIFDRIRETRKKPGFTQKPVMEIVEYSVSSTLSRTINTTLTTMFTLVCLYIFGVSSIREFAFPLVVGMLAGTYSSVMLSGQVWAMWCEKKNARKNEKAKKGE